MQAAGRWTRLIVIALGVVLVLLGALWWGLPALLVSQLPPRLGELLGRPVRLEAAEFVPWRLELTLRGLRIGAAGEAAGATTRPLLQIDSVRTNISTASLVALAPVVEALQVDGLRLNLARTAAGQYDIDDIVQRLAARPKAEPAAEPARFSLNNLSLRDAQVHFDDRPVGRSHALQALTLTLPFLSNLPAKVNIHTEPRLAFTLNGTRFDTGSQVLPFAESRSGSMSLAFEDFDLKPLLAYLPDNLPVRVLGARLSTRLELQFALPPAGSPSVTLKGPVTVRDLAVADGQGAPLAGWKSLSLGLVDVQPLQRRIGLGDLVLDGLDLHLSRDARGQTNLQRLQGTRAPPAQAAAPAPAASASAAAPAWNLALAKLQLTNGRVRWTDDAVKPQAALQVDELGLQVDALRWPAPASLPVALQGSLRPQREGAAAVGQFKLNGQADLQQAALVLKVDGFDLAALAPYLAQALKPQLSGTFATEARLNWQAEPAGLSVKVDTASLQDLQLRDGNTPRANRLASLKRLAVAGIDVDVTGRRVSVGSVQIVQPAMAVSRDAEGRFNLQQWAAAQPAQRTATAPAAAAPPVARPGPAAPATPPWRLLLKDLSLTGGQVQWRDAAVTDASHGGPVQADLSQLKLRLQGLAWPAAAGTTALPRLQVSARLGAPVLPGTTPALGEIDWNGRFGMVPAQADGRLKIQRFPVHLFAPYAGDALPVSLLHADFGFEGQLRLRQADAGWQVGTEGDVLVSELQVNSLPAPGASADSGSELLTWQALSLQGLNLALAPPARPQLAVREVALNDFYARLLVTEQGRLNLQDVAAKPKGAPAQGDAPVAAPAASAAASATPAAPAAAAGAAAAASAVAARPLDGLPLDIDIGSTQLRNGRVDFTDRFIRPNYSARLTELNGSVSRLRSGTREMATVALRGRAAETALLDISGELNPTVNPPALNIRARATDLELAPLSAYSGKYAGYGIERGKLSVNLSYKIDADGKLEANNEIIINQLTFGDKVESPSATKLPVLLAVALLQDRNGVIDLNLPVTGTLNDPQFSVGALIWKVIVNLLTKAVTAPFSLFAGPGTNDLSQVEFVPGTATPSDSGRQTLEKVAKALVERPALIMTVTGSADTQTESEPARKVLLDEKLQAEGRRERMRAASQQTVAAAAAASAPLAVRALSAEERSRYLKQVYQQTALPNKPRNLIGLAKDLPPPEMEAMLLASITVDETVMRELALQRGLAVRDALMAAGLPNERLFLAAPKLHTPGEAGAAWTPSVTLTLSAK